MAKRVHGLRLRPANRLQRDRWGVGTGVVFARLPLLREGFRRVGERNRVSRFGTRESKALQSADAEVTNIGPWSPGQGALVIIEFRKSIGDFLI